MSDRELICPRIVWLLNYSLVARTSVKFNLHFLQIIFHHALRRLERHFVCVLRIEWK